LTDLLARIRTLRAPAATSTEIAAALNLGSAARVEWLERFTRAGAVAHITFPGAAHLTTTR
jgi:hypothetical protein